MEDTLRAVTVSSILSLETVLILVLMEDTLRAVSKGRYKYVVS